MNEIEDLQVLELYRTKGGAEKAFGLLLGKYQERVYWHIRKIVLDHEDANDVLQNTFIKVWKGLTNFRGDSELFTWIYRIATNEALSFIKKKAAKSARSYDDPEMSLANKLEADEYFDGNEIQRKLYEAVSKLPGKQKLVFQMKYFDDMKYEKISGILDTSVGALKASFHHAVRKIKEELEED